MDNRNCKTKTVPYTFIIIIVDSPHYDHHSSKSLYFNRSGRITYNVYQPNCCFYTKIIWWYTDKQQCGNDIYVCTRFDIVAKLAFEKIFSID